MGATEVVFFNDGKVRGNRKKKRRFDFMRLDEIESSVELKVTSSMIFLLFEFYLLNC